MLSRVAESIYWMSRYVERAENVARFIEVNFNLTLGEELTFGDQWQPLINTTGDDDDFNARYEATASRDNVIRFLLFDKENPNSIISCVARARENARAIRQVIPSVVWEELNKFYLLTKQAAAEFAMNSEQDLNEVQAFCEQVRVRSFTLTGALDATMTKSEAWQFARLGQMLERADKTSRIVDVQYFILLPETDDVGTPVDIVRWTALLQSSNAFEMYRRQHGNITPHSVAEFLILDRFFSRSMHHCVLNAQQSLWSISNTPPGSFQNEAERKIGKLNASMDYASIDEIIVIGMHEYLDGFQTQLNGIGDAISQAFFTWEPAYA